MIMVSQSLTRWVLTASIVTAVCAAPSIVHEKRDTVPSGFTLLGSAPAEQTLNMRINLAMGNQAGLESALEEASTPTSPTFREWLTKEQVCILHTMYIKYGLKD